MLFPNTAGEKASYLINKLMEYRKSQFNLIDGEFLNVVKLGEATAINLTKMSGGKNSEKLLH